ncbi:hypothetical protein HKBW3S44_01469, partial [Candidatus Hakubella thermalkaliphila]
QIFLSRYWAFFISQLSFIGEIDVAYSVVNRSIFPLFVQSEYSLPSDMKGFLAKDKLPVGS